MSNNDEPGHNQAEEQLRSKLDALHTRVRLTTSRKEFLNRLRENLDAQRETTAKEEEISDLLTILNQRSKQISTNVRFRDVGTVQHIGNGVATVSGLPNVSIDEIVTFPTGVQGMALNLDQKHVDLILLGPDQGIRGGDQAEATGKRLKVPVGPRLLGRIINPLGQPLDRDEAIIASEYRVTSRIAPGIIERTPVHEPLYTGTKIVDALYPIGRGQRELIIGDRQTGKTTLAVDAILNQKSSAVRCIYVAIGQKKSSILSVIETIKNGGVFSQTTIIISSPDDPPALRYLAPYTGMTLAEYFLDQGDDILVVFDDLSKHADAYRELSLLLRRPPGREAYPGDIFYLHSRLLERACKLKEENGGGSITAIPIATTQSGNISAYIPTNLISITDGQIVLDADLFHKGQKPAVDIGRSVSRVGGAAQEPAMRSLVGDLRLELSQYEEVAQFARFGTEVNAATRRQIEKGDRILKALTQKPHQPVSFPLTIVLLYALANNLMDQIPLKEVPAYQEALKAFFTRKEPKLLTELQEKGTLDAALEDQMDAALADFNAIWSEEKGVGQ
jgi:F-type H+-transporting ATPase subunit alpha